MRPYGKRRNTGTYLTAGVCLAAALGAMIGCEGGNKKVALTPEEIRQRTYAPKPDRPGQILISGEPITYEDILSEPPSTGVDVVPFRAKLAELAKQTTYEQFAEVVRPEVKERLDGRISNIVLAKQTERELGDKIEDQLDQLAEQELRRFIQEEHNGNAAQADAALQRAGMNRFMYKEWAKRQRLAEEVFKLRYPRNRPITYGDLLARYNEIKEGQFARQGVLQLRVIDIRVDKVESEPDADPLRKARQLAEEFRKRIDAGEDFAGLAKQSQRYTDDPRAGQGGLWRPRDPNSLAAPYDVLARKAQEMAPGQVDGPIEVPGRFFLIKVEEKQGRSYQPLSEVQEQVRKSILEDRYRQVLKELNAEVSAQIAAVDTGPFVEYCLQRMYQEARSADRG